MSNSTDDQRERRDDDQAEGTFVGGSFGRDRQGQDSPTTAQQVEAEHDDPSSTPVAAPAEVQETLDDTLGSASSGTGSTTDVEGIGTEPAPGDRNEPV